MEIYSDNTKQRYISFMGLHRGLFCPDPSRSSMHSSNRHGIMFRPRRLPRRKKIKRDSVYQLARFRSYHSEGVALCYKVLNQRSHCLYLGQNLRTKIIVFRFFFRLHMLKSFLVLLCRSRKVAFLPSVPSTLSEPLQRKVYARTVTKIYRPTTVHIWALPSSFGR